LARYIAVSAFFASVSKSSPSVCLFKLRRKIAVQAVKVGPFHLLCSTPSRDRISVASDKGNDLCILLKLKAVFVEYFEARIDRAGIVELAPVLFYFLEGIIDAQGRPVGAVR